MRAPTFGSLFAGVGGFDLGLEAAGWQCAFQVEWDKHCQSVLRHHWPTVPKWGDVQEVDGATLPPVDMITFGSPCQDLSVAGKRAGLQGGRSSMFFEATRIIREMRNATNNVHPRTAIWENVPGALNSNNGADFGAVLKEMVNLGAVVIEWAVLDAQHFGVPQRRRRVFVVAIFDPATADRCPDPLLPVEEGAKRNCDANTAAITFYRTQGKHDQPQIDKAPPLKTISPVCIANADGPPRAMTPIEHERLMGWPDDHTRYTDTGKEQADTRRYRQCGNGVAAPVAEWIGRHLHPLHVHHD